MKGDSTLKKTLKTLYGPDDLLGTAESTDPRSCVIEWTQVELRAVRRRRTSSAPQAARTNGVDDEPQ